MSHKKKASYKRDTNADMKASMGKNNTQRRDHTGRSGGSMKPRKRSKTPSSLSRDDETVEVNATVHLPVIDVPDISFDHRKTENQTNKHQSNKEVQVPLKSSLKQVDSEKVFM